MSQLQPWAEPPAEPPRSGLGLGFGALIGVVVGLLGPIVLAGLAWAVSTISSDRAAGDLTGLVILAILATPVVLLVAGCVLMVPDALRGWGVAALVASGIWLISSAGVCTVVLFGALATYDSGAFLP